MCSDPSVELVLLVPGLLGPGGAGAGDPGAAQALVEGLDLDGLDRLLSRAEHTEERRTDTSLEALALRSFGYDAPPAGADFPVAAFTALVDCDAGEESGDRSEEDETEGLPVEGEGGSRSADTEGGLPSTERGGGSRLVEREVGASPAEGEGGVRPVEREGTSRSVQGGGGFRLRADPVHLRADIADLVLFDAARADLSRAEADALARIVNDALGPDGPHIDAAHPHRWYVALDAPARIATTPLSLATGARVSEAMPRGPDAPRWHRWMNEVQMALHECPVNAERERRGAVPINSVWPWGAGSLPPAAPAPFVGTWSDEALVRGLARHAGVERGAMPAGARAWLDGEPRPGVHLVVFADLYPAVRRADIDLWRSAVAHFSAAWAQPLLGALDRGAVARVAMRDERGNRFTSTRRGRFRWWRRAGLAARIATA